MNNTTSSSSNGYDFIAAANQATFYAFSVTMTFIVITNILNACVFSRQALRSSSCTYYFLASIPPVLAYVVVTPLNTILIYTINFRLHGTPVTCKLVQYTVYGSPLLYESMLVCASVDRFCSSSNSVRLRRFSQVPIARKFILGVWILILLYMSPFMAAYCYDYSSSLSNKCLASTSTLAAVYLMTRVVLYYFAIPIILAIFDALTINNIRTQTRRVTVVHQVNYSRRTEGQLTRMLIIQVIVYFLFFTSAGITYIIVTFVSSMNTSYYNTIRTLTVVWQQGGFFTTFFLYTLTGKVYRQELRKMFRYDQIRAQISQLSVHTAPMNAQTHTMPAVGIEIHHDPKFN